MKRRIMKTSGWFANALVMLIALLIPWAAHGVPMVTVSEPADGTVFSESPITVSGTVSETGARVSVSGSGIVVKQDPGAGKALGSVVSLELVPRAAG